MALPVKGVRCCVTGWPSVVLLSAALCLAATGRASLITINPTFDATITSDPNFKTIESTINAAINYYDTTFTTGFSPLTVNITFQEDKTHGSLGSSSTAVYPLTYQSFSTALNSASSGDATDTTALAKLPPAGLNPVNGSRVIIVSSANCRALGIACNPTDANGNPAPDGSIFLNTDITNPGSPGTTSQYSLFAVTEHEIDEVLGLGSDANNSTGDPFFNDPRPEDLFRYDSNGKRIYNSFVDDAWFSLDGTTRLVQFNNAANGGDYGDWWSHNGGGNPGPNPPPRVQDAFAFPGTNPTLATDPGQPEVVALDAIGYNLSSVRTPEPTTTLMVGSGLLVAVLLSRRRAR